MPGSDGPRVSGASITEPGGAGWRSGLARHWRWIVVALYMAVVFGSSSQSSLPESVQSVSDKLLHFVAYGGLSLTIAWAATRGRLRDVTLSTVGLAAIVSTVYGLSDEFHQLFVPSRTFDAFDFMADALGAFAAAGTVWAWSIISRGRREGHGV